MGATTSDRLSQQQAWCDVSLEEGALVDFTRITDATSLYK